MSNKISIVLQTQKQRTGRKHTSLFCPAMILPGAPVAGLSRDPNDPMSSILPRMPSARVSKTFTIDRSQAADFSHGSGMTTPQPMHAHGNSAQADASSPTILVGDPQEIAKQIQQRQIAEQQQQQQQLQQTVYNVVNVGASNAQAMFAPMLFSVCCTQQPGIESMPLVSMTGNGGTFSLNLMQIGNAFDLPALQSPWTFWKIFSVGSYPIVGKTRSSTVLSTIEPGSRVQMEPFDTKRGGFYMVFPSSEVKDSNSFRLLCCDHLDESQNTTIVGQHQDFVRVEKREDSAACFYRVSFRQEVSQLAYCTSGYATRFRGRTIPTSGTIGRVQRNDVLEFEQVVESPWIGFGVISLA